VKTESKKEESEYSYYTDDEEEVKEPKVFKTAAQKKAEYDGDYTQEEDEDEEEEEENEDEEDEEVQDERPATNATDEQQKVTKLPAGKSDPELAGMEDEADLPSSSAAGQTMNFDLIVSEAAKVEPIAPASQFKGGHPEEEDGSDTSSKGKGKSKKKQGQSKESKAGIFKD
jgi:hypothetical protein